MKNITHKLVRVDERTWFKLKKRALKERTTIKAVIAGFVSA